MERRKRILKIKAKHSGIEKRETEKLILKLVFTRHPKIGQLQTD